MQRWQPFVLALGGGIAVFAFARADLPAFNVNPGLWQVTTSGSASGAPSVPAEALAQLTPQQRAQVEAAMKGAMARATAPRTSRFCITAEQLRRNPDFTRGGKSCQQSVVTRTATDIELRQSCNGAETGLVSATTHLTARDRQTVVGTTLVTQNNGGKPVTIRQQVSGRWLGPDCGTVKPGQMEQ